jgi:vacuolar-type H+-ATPase subunit E/Vma4
VDIQAIIDGIFAAGEQEIASIESKAHGQVNSIRSTAEAEANKQKDRILKDAHVRLNRTQAVISQRADMQSLQMHANARQQLILLVLEKAKEDLDAIRFTGKYPAVLQVFIQDAIHTILPSLVREQKMILHVDKRDENTLNSLEIPYKDRILVEFDAQCSGGCEVETDDGLVRVLNTFESRFERALPKIQQDLSVYFEEHISSS